MDIEQLTPWISLLSGVLSVGYLVGDEMRHRARSSRDGEGDASARVSVGAAIREHDIVVITAVTLFFLAGLAHWYLQSTAYFYPVLIWGTAAFLVVATAVAEIAEDEYDDAPGDR